MLDRQTTIMTAAFDVFSRYGFKRATMADIASEAGVARQTLYNAFANKEAILRGLIEAHVEQTCKELTAHLEANGSLEDGLELAFDHFARKPYQLIHKTPHGGEIMEALDNSASEEMAESKARFSEGMIAVLKPHISAESPANLRAEELADFVVHTAMGHKMKASSEEHLEKLLGTLKRLVVSYCV
ncbi:MAG: TetR/AcrR family transcriptional regulator [Rhizobiaceae bacterium]|nr:TetR/AcrR family transcriptional regulator [Rhizobiaceae bacterium]